MSTTSTIPPKYPEIIPMEEPSSVTKTAAKIPTMSAVLVPKIT